MESSTPIFEKDPLLECLLSLSEHPFFVLDRDELFVEASEAFCKRIGCTRASLLNRKIKELLTSHSCEIFADSWADVLRGETVQSHHAFVSLHGKQVEFSARFQILESSSGSLIYVSCEEISLSLEDRKLAKLQIRALEETENAVLITDAEGLVIWANRSFSRCTGYPINEVIGQTPGLLLKSGKYPKAFYKQMWQTIQQGIPWQGDIINRRKDGSLYPEELTISPIRDASGEVTHYISVKHDLSEKKNLQDMFLKALRLENIGVLVSGIAHDLNNVLAPIMMSSDLLLLETDNKETCEMLNMIKLGTQKGAETIRQLSTFAKGDSDKLMEMQLRHVLKDLLKIFREIFPNSITITDRISSDLHPLIGNANQLHQVFTNLFINSRDAMPQGGTLFIKAQNVSLNQQDADRFEDAYAGEFVCVRVSDEGVGIPKEIQKKVFNSFFTTKDSETGTGLGLSNAAEIVKKHHGFITMVSEVGMGTSFDVYLPTFRGRSAEAQSQEMKPIPGGKGETLLVVDDEESIRVMLQNTLKSLGYKVEVASGGKQGVDWWKEHQQTCDLILLDIVMPEMDGIAVFRELKKNNCASEIIFMSGLSSVEKLKGTGIDSEKSFISKPFSILDLAKKIRLHLDNRNAV